MQKESFIYFDQLWDYGRRSFDELEYWELARLTGLLMKEWSPVDKDEFIIKSMGFDELIGVIQENLLSQIFPDKVKNADKMLSLEILKCTSSFAKSMIDEMFHRQDQAYVESQREKRELGVLEARRIIDED